MLPRRSRLTRAGFPAASLGKRVSAAHFSVSYTREGQDGAAAAVISKKVAPKSVDRHLLKRRILAVARPYTNARLSFVVYARKGAAALPFKAVKEELGPLLATLGA